MCCVNSERSGTCGFTSSLFEVAGIMTEAFTHSREERDVMTKRTDSRICVKRKIK
jgi:hypothetical protein